MPATTLDIVVAPDTAVHGWVGENNGCYQSSQRAEYQAFVADLPEALSGMAKNAGEQFSILGWQRIKLR
ncbi:hypothetical protein [Mesorhizobium sp.]|uniref:hypothetical protein n=1 Tax=Mesorhizobium sp. TaxID=1871066 RepID=UPI000FE2D664|nr:hypothetical protein [Mesorhizobium sp.]RWQ18522.1 MAG: hypothetical protein EOR92_15485 [Mesorhizobium sp.]